MKKIFLPLVMLLALMLYAGCKHSATSDSQGQDNAFVRAADDGRFYIGDSVYKFVGTNFWYGAILASEGEGGDRERLARELDLLQSLGIDNLRILVGGEGSTELLSHIRPVLQPEPGVYNDTILDGLDYLMAELERRNMKAVLYLGNAWEWSGGYGTYLEWAGEGKAPDPTVDGYDAYTDFCSRFVKNDSARAMYDRHVRYIVGRENRYTKQPYSASPALMAWEVANEPRAFASDSVTKDAFYDFVITTAKSIKELDSNHMVATGSEGSNGCQQDIDLWAKVHNSPEIDYAIIHIWPLNWSWITAENAVDSVGVAIANTMEYIDDHRQLTKKPLVIEEFGYPRDGKAYTLDSSVKGRDEYYRKVFEVIGKGDKVAGINFWAWGGLGEPRHEMWQPWDAYVGDPAQEPQGLYSVFASDTTTLAIIRAATGSLR